MKEVNLVQVVHVVKVKLKEIGTEQDSCEEDGDLGAPVLHFDSPEEGILPISDFIVEEF